MTVAKSKSERETALEAWGVLPSDANKDLKAQLLRIADTAMQNYTKAARDLEREIGFSKDQTSTVKSAALAIAAELSLKGKAVAAEYIVTKIFQDANEVLSMTKADGSARISVVGEAKNNEGAVAVLMQRGKSGTYSGSPIGLRSAGYETVGEFLKEAQRENPYDSDHVHGVKVAKVERILRAFNTAVEGYVPAEQARRMLPTMNRAPA